MNGEIPMPVATAFFFVAAGLIMLVGGGEILVSGATRLARRLGMSARSLQRKLGSEGTSFQAELQGLRTRLAKNYLTATNHSSAEISFLLGYDDPNSFIRAFHDWTGTTPEAMRRAS